MFKWLINWNQKPCFHITIQVIHHQNLKFSAPGQEKTLTFKTTQSYKDCCPRASTHNLNNKTKSEEKTTLTSSTTWIVCTFYFISSSRQYGARSPRIAKYHRTRIFSSHKELPETNILAAPQRTDERGILSSQHEDAYHVEAQLAEKRTYEYT